MNSVLVSALVATLLILPGASGARAQADETDSAAVRTLIEANDQAVGRAIATRDFAALQTLWSPEMVVNSPGNNILNRSQVFAAMREDKLAYTSVKSTTDAFSVFKDVALGPLAITMASWPISVATSLNTEKAAGVELTRV